MSQNMQQRFRLYRRGWGVYYVEDTQTRKHTSLGTSDKLEAQLIVHAKNEAHRRGSTVKPGVASVRLTTSASSLGHWARTHWAKGSLV